MNLRADVFACIAHDCLAGSRNDSAVPRRSQGLRSCTRAFAKIPIRERCSRNRPLGEIFPSAPSIIDHYCSKMSRVYVELIYNLCVIETNLLHRGKGPFSFLVSVLFNILSRVDIFVNVELDN